MWIVKIGKKFNNVNLSEFLRSKDKIFKPFY